MKITNEGNWCGEQVRDPEAFVFSLQSNGRLNRKMKFDILKEKENEVFMLHCNSKEDLFSIGSTDIMIKRFNNKLECYCQQLSFNYEDKEKTLTGIEGLDNPIPIKRIYVIEMEETEETIQLRKQQEEKEREEEHQKLQLKTNEIKEELST